MDIPKTGDTVVRTSDGVRGEVVAVVEAGGENLYRLRFAAGDELEVEGGAFVKTHDAERASFEITR